jgi:hypothetical protein
MIASFPKVPVAVTLIHFGSDLLLVYNAKWGAFTLPMTKQRRWPHPSDPCKTFAESWENAATRNLAEWLGRTFTSPPQHILDIEDYQQSDRDLKTKQYHFRLFAAAVDSADERVVWAAAESLSPAEILDPDRRPISPTARMLVQQLLELGKL